MLGTTTVVGLVLHLRLQRLGLMLEVLAVPFERAERAEPDAALAHVNVAARLHVHRQVLLDHEALLPALGARKRLLALKWRRR